MSVLLTGNLNALSDISLRQIECFLTAVKYGNITHAANELFTTQATVSRNIKNLEHELGFELVYREPRGIRPTTEGNILYKEWSGALKNIIHGFEKAWHAANPDITQINIADYMDASKSNYLIPVITLFEMENPNIQINIVELDKFHADLLDIDEFDVAFIQDCDLKNIKGIYAHEIINIQNIVILMNKENKLAVKKNITLNDLVDETIILGNNALLRGASEQITSIFFQKGIIPQKIELCHSLFELKMKLLQNKGITIASEIFSLCNDPQMKSYPIENEFAETHIVWSKKNLNYAIKNFLKCAKQIKSKTRLNV